MHQILPRLYLGAFADVPQSSQEITRVFTLCERVPDTSIHLLYASIPDEVFLASHVWQRLVDLLGALMDQGHTVLVHCRLGVSRSPALVTAYLTVSEGLSLEGARAHVENMRPEVKIHEDTWRGVQVWHSQRPT